MKKEIKLSMFSDDSNEGNIKRAALVAHYKKEIPDWVGTYGQGFADCFNWIFSEYKKSLTEVTKEEYHEALNVINEYRKNINSLDVYERIKSEMMATTDITLEELDDVIGMWVAIKDKELSIKSSKID